MNIIIVGAGSAGLLSAAVLTNKIKDVKVTIIKSPTQKVIGVGESTVGSFKMNMIEYAGINYNNLIEKVKPVNKLGVWFSFGKKDFHYTFDYAFQQHLLNEPKPIGFKFKGGNFGNSLRSQLMLLGKEGNGHIPGDTELSEALHLPNERFLVFLTDLLKERGVEFITDHINTVERDSNNNIISLNKKYNADLFIDSSGFNSVLSNEKWISYEDALVNDTALIFQSKPDLNPYTKATTMNNGWLWEISHQDKKVSGYVFSSKYTNEKEVLNELIDYNIKDYKIVKFKTGRREKHWVNNVITIGNAGMFVEPLESTSLMCLLGTINDVSYILNSDHKESLIELFNDTTNEVYDNVRDFVLAHFCFNDKLDTKYWRDYKERRYLLGDTSKKIINYYIKNDVNIKYTDSFFINQPFGLEGWFSILRGLDVKSF